ncbi:Protein-disulfide isomerase OS=Bosea thiooxidans OX=53254 GN=SAMN05660750_02213 PE=3 SV=1 [Bosea thiooxidans]|uniref:Protein-disulfide isomerase n=2 Tax=Bosea thiooxidans TaxID=53254 RepID=A0A1T5DYA4_9HYPH|nr:DsbA family protein [Bosea thiooxidans]SKB76822.1 Protein-disulfide isomerase [Bosea thiooxidans]
MQIMQPDRRAVLAGLSLLAASLPGFAFAQSGEVDAEAILNDPEAPVAGNPAGDVTIVAFLDYNCPYCRTSAPDLARIVKEDGKIRLVYKEWPVITESSVYAAQLALAAAHQGAYQRVHDALMASKGRLSKEQISAVIGKAGIDLTRLQADLDTHADKITAQLRRNMAQADSLGLQGTPTYLVGPFRTSTLNYAGFKQVVADARKKQAAQ